MNEGTSRGPGTAPERILELVHPEAARLPVDSRPSRLERALRAEWLGQTLASVCWNVSVFVYGISSPGDWLQLAAASSWLVANLAAVVTVKTD